jgi:hypothetical protein
MAIIFNSFKPNKNPHASDSLLPQCRGFQIILPCVLEKLTLVVRSYTLRYSLVGTVLEPAPRVRGNRIC